MTHLVRAFPWARWLAALAATGALAAFASALLGRPPPWWLVAGAALTVGVAVLAGLFLIGSGLFARPILAARADRATGRLALTFDDGPDREATRAILDTLDARGHRATFFVIGSRAAAEPALLSEIVRRGHALGNHSFEHRRSSALRSSAWLARDLDRAQELLAAAGEPGRWFRPPIGIVSPPVVAAAARARLELVGWTRSARDGVARRTVAAALRRLLPAIRPGAILVLHDGAERRDRRPIAPQTLPLLLDAIEARGLRSVTLDELLAPSEKAVDRVGSGA